MANTENFNKYFEITDYEQLYYQIDKEQKERHELTRKYLENEQKTQKEIAKILNTTKESFWQEADFNKLDSNLQNEVNNMRNDLTRQYNQCLEKGFMPKKVDDYCKKHEKEAAFYKNRYKESMLAPLYYGKQSEKILVKYEKEMQLKNMYSFSSNMDSYENLLKKEIENLRLRPNDKGTRLNIEILNSKIQKNRLEIQTKHLGANNSDQLFDLNNKIQVLDLAKERLLKGISIEEQNRNKKVELVNHKVKNIDDLIRKNILENSTLILTADIQEQQEQKVSERKNTIDDRSELQETKKQKMTTQENKHDISIKIDEANFTKNPEFAKILKTGQEFKGDDLQAFLQTMVVMDEAIASKNEKNLEFSGDSIKLQLSDIDGSKIDINAKLGEGYFSKDLDHLVNLGSKDISKNPPSQEAKEIFNKAVEREPAQEPQKDKDLDKANTTEIENVGTKKEPLRFKNPASSASLDNILNGGIQAMATMAESVGDEAISGFAKNVCDMYKGVGGIIPSSVSKSMPSMEEQMNQINNQNVKKVNQAIKEGKVKIASKQKEKERSNNKDRSVDR